jgi:transcription termination/antitermination protein NusG
MAKQWFVVHTYSGHEKKVQENIQRAARAAGLEEAFGDVIVATEEFAEMKEGKRTVSRRRTFPSYVLLNMDMSEATRTLVANVPGVTGFVGSGPNPIALKESEIDRIKGRMKETKGGRPAPESKYRVGEHVRVVDGPFNGFTGVVDETHPERGKLKVMVSIFGRATPVELDYLQVQPV